MLGLFLGALLSQSSAHARLPIQVRGASSLTATAQFAPDGDSVQIEGFLRDDLNGPLAAAVIELSTTTPRRGPSRVLAVQACAADAMMASLRGNPPTATLRPVGTSTSAGTLTRADGSFCAQVRTSELPEAAPVSVQFRTTNTHEGASMLVDVSDRRASVAIELSRLPARVALENGTLEFDVVARSLARTLDISMDAVVLLSTSNTDASPRRLLSLPIRLGMSNKIAIRTSDLAPPGPAEIVVQVAGNGKLRPAAARARILRTAVVTPTAQQLPHETTAGEPVQLTFMAQHPFGRATSGAMELSLGGAKRGLANVDADGLARFSVDMPRALTTQALSIAYVPSDERYERGAPASFDIRLRRPSAWRYVGWTAAGFLVLGWLAWARRQPPAVQAVPLAPQAPIARAHIEVLGPASHRQVGWEGYVVDAHDGTALESAEVAIVVRGFGRSPVVFETLTGKLGEFSIPAGLVPDPSQAEVRVKLRAYSTFTTSLPKPGQIRLHLISARRAVLDRLIDWTRRRGAPFRAKSEASPDWVAEVARLRGQREIERWARAVSTAAFGQDVPLDDQSPQLLPPTGPSDGTLPIKRPES